MSEVKFDVLGIGNAIVDVLADVGEEILTANGFEKGSMILIDECSSQKLSKEVEIKKICSGGSAANTMVGMASLGSSVAFIGKVRDDELGSDFLNDIKSTDFFINIIYSLY